MEDLTENIGQYDQAKRWPAALEYLVLIVVALLPFAGLPGLTHLLASLHWNWTDDLPHEVKVLITGGLIFGALTLPILLLIRFVKNQTLVILGSVIAVTVIWTAFYSTQAAPVIRQIRQADTVGLLDGTVLLSTWIAFLKHWLWALLSVMGGFFAVRRKFGYGRLIAGTVITGWITKCMLWPWALLGTWGWLCPFLFAVFAVVLVMLPGQRAAFERLLKFPLRKGEAVYPSAGTQQVSPFFYILLVLLGMGIASFGAISYFEQVQSYRVYRGAPHSWRSPALTNASNDLKELFVKSPATPVITKMPRPKAYEVLIPLAADVLTSETIAPLLQKADRTKIEPYLASIAKFTQALERASRADYLELPASQSLNYLNIRETIRAISIRAQLAMAAGKADAATSDVLTLYRFSALLQDQGPLVEQMVGIAVRNTATRAIANMLLIRPNDHESLKAFAEALESVRPIAQSGLNLPAIKADELSAIGGPITPNAEITVPAFGRAHRDALLSWVNFDLLRMGVALERYRLNHGSYPAALNALAPEYLATIPREPFTGEPYNYESTLDSYTIGFPALPKLNEKGIVIQLPGKVAGVPAPQ